MMNALAQRRSYHLPVTQRTRLARRAPASPMALEGVLDLLVQLNEKITALEQRVPRQMVLQPRPAMPALTQPTHLIQEQAEPVAYDEPVPTQAPTPARPRRVKVRRANLRKIFD